MVKQDVVYYIDNGHASFKSEGAPMGNVALETTLLEPVLDPVLEISREDYISGSIQQFTLQDNVPLPAHPIPSTGPLVSLEGFEPPVGNPATESCDPVSSENLQLIGSSAVTLGTTPLSGPSGWMGVSEMPEHSVLMDSFFGGFLPSVSPQFCDPRLSPSAVFVPQFVADPLLKEVFYACGAAYLSNTVPGMRELAQEKYEQCLMQFSHRVDQSVGDAQDWMVAVALLLCLRDKFIGTTPEISAIHLAKTLRLIRELRKSTEGVSVNLKVFVESFLFNYSVMIITGGESVLKFLPSPFEIFDEVRLILDYHPYQCPVPWMENPVFGAATKTVEIAAKLSWLLSQYPLNDADMALACNLLSETYKIRYPPMAPDAEIRLGSQSYFMLQESVTVSEIVRHSCQLLLMRLIIPNLELLHISIKQKVALIYDMMKGLSEDSPLWVILGWLMMITGLNSIQPDHRSFLIHSLYRCASKFHAAFLVQIADFLEKVWIANNDSQDFGWSVIFDKKLLSNICI